MDIRNHAAIVTGGASGLGAATAYSLVSGVLFGQLGAEPTAKKFYHELQQSLAFHQLIPWPQIEPEAYDGLILPGGHAPGMRQYLGSLDNPEFILYRIRPSRVERQPCTGSACVVTAPCTLPSRMRCAVWS